MTWIAECATLLFCAGAVAQNVCAGNEDEIRLVNIREYRDNVQNVLEHALPKCMDRFPKGRGFEEPDYTAGLAIGLPQIISEAVANTIGLKFGGCFVHQSPIVTFKYGEKCQRCELGDLLVLCRERQDGGERFNAALLQLKMAKEKREKLNWKQLKLYSEWPCFCIGESFENQPKFDILPKCPTQGALYSYVHAGDELRFTVSPTQKKSKTGRIDPLEGVSIQEFLADFVIGLAGRSISDRDECQQDGWSYLIWSIIDRLKDAVFKRRNISIDNSRNTKERFPREIGDFFELLSDSESIESEIQLCREEIKRRENNNAPNCPIEDSDSVGVRGLLFIDRMQTHAAEN